MITGFIINAFYSLLSSLLSVFPEGDLGIPTEFTNGITLIVQYLHAWSWLLPVDHLLSAVITVVSFYVVLLGIQSVLWVIRTIRGSGS